MVTARSGGTGPAATPPRRFAWHETARVLADLEATHAGARLEPAPRGFRLVGSDGGELARVVVPLVLRVQPGETADALRGRLHRPLGRELVLLVRAGAAALGLWHDGELRAHKTFARYVVRGSGRAQPTHLKTKGKSRYGSRLRLQNAQRLLAEVNERVAAWWDAVVGFDAVYLACPERIWPELRRAEPVPRFDGVLEPIRIPLHVHEPKHEELLRVRRALEHGVVTLP